MRALDIAYAPFIHYARMRIDASCDVICSCAASMRRYALWMTVNGRMRLRRGDDDIVLPRGGSALLPPMCGWRVALAQSDLAAYVVFDVVHQKRKRGSGEARSADDATIQPSPEDVWGVELPLPLPEPEWPAARRAMMLVNRLWWLSSLDHLRANNVLGEWLLELVARQIGTTSSSTDPLDMAETWARRHLAGGADVAGMAEVAGMSRPRFCTIYHERRGRPAGDFLDDLRVTEAVRRIRGGDETLAEVAKASAGGRPRRWCAAAVRRSASIRGNGGGARAVELRGRHRAVHAAAVLMRRCRMPSDTPKYSRSSPAACSSRSDTLPSAWSAA